MTNKTIIKNNREYIIKRHWKKKPMIVFFIIVVMLSAGTYAWFASTNTEESDSLVAGRVAIDVANTLHTSQYVLPGEDVEGNVSITNTSNVAVYLRVKIFVDTADFYEGMDTFDTIFNLSLGSTWVKKGDWYYYKGLLTSGVSIPSVISSFSVKGTVGNEYQGKSFTVKSTSDSIQGTENALESTWIANGDILESDKADLNY